MAEQRVLVVEDEPMVAEVVERYLRRDGYNVRTVQDGKAALEAHESFRPDLVVLDVMLPEVDGMEVCRRIRARSQTPVIILTARALSTRPHTIRQSCAACRRRARNG
jgi:two-component system response regulator AdeR